MLLAPTKFSLRGRCGKGAAPRDPLLSSLMPANKQNNDRDQEAFYRINRPDYFLCVYREVYCSTVKIGSTFFSRLCLKIINHWMSTLLLAYRNYLALYQIVLHQLWHLQFRYLVYCMIYSRVKHKAYLGAICRSEF
jgi:hypothetical protein